MSDKSPRQSMSKKSVRSLKEKRADKRTQAEQTGRIDDLPNTRRR